MNKQKSKEQFTITQTHRHYCWMCQEITEHRVETRGDWETVTCTRCKNQNNCRVR